MLEADELGKVVHIEANFSNNMSQYTKAWRSTADESPAGGMTSLGLHAVDTFIHLLGPVTSLVASSRNIAMPFDVDDSTNMLMNFVGGQSGFSPMWFPKPT